LGKFLSKVENDREELRRRNEMDNGGENVSTPILPITVSVKEIKDLLDLLISLHPHGHHGQELFQIDIFNKSIKYCQYEYEWVSFYSQGYL
jgi:hypothetical protein